jgi:uncharacterized membrane protein (Fun14 family)
MEQVSQWSSNIPGPFLWQLGGSAIAGMAVAYALKKATKLALFLLGAGILMLYGLSQWGIVTVHWDALTQHLDSGKQVLGQWAGGMFSGLGANMAGFGGGVLLGLKLR